MQKLSRFFVVALFIVLCMGVSSIAEEITLTTYYPAPLGNYDELRATKLAVGSSTTMPATDGDLEAAGTIQANTAFNINGEVGVSGVYTGVSDIRIVGIDLQKRTRSVTVKGGIITEIDNQTDWVTVGQVN